jgi:hypothetical protein
MLKKSVCNDLRNSPRVNKDLFARLEHKVAAANMNVRKEEFDAQFLDWRCTQCPDDHA